MGKTFEVDATRRIDDFLRRRGLQQYKIPLLIAAGAVFRGREGEALKRIATEEERVQEGDQVFVNDDTNDVFTKKLNDLRSEDFRDYIFSSRDKFNMAMAEIVSLRGNNIRLDAATTLVAFIKALGSDPKVTNPIKYLFVISHASEEGFLFTALDAVDASISFEDLEKVGNAIRIDPEILKPRPKDESGRVVDPILHIRGCEIGSAAPYMQKLKAALGGSIQITAPLFYHAVEKVNSPPGRIEYMKYHFRIFSRDLFEKRADILAAFDKRKFKDLNGADIPKQNWDKWVPASNFRKPQQEVRVEVVSPLNKTKTKVKGYFQYRVRYFFPKDSKYFYPPTARTDEDRRKWHLDQIRKWPYMRDDHPFPVYKRLGYKSFDEFSFGWNWEFRPEGDKFNVNVFRHEYEVLQPVVEPSTRLLFLNFFPLPGLRKPPASIMGLPDGDKRFFGVY